MKRVEWRSRVRLVDEVTDVLRERIYAGRFAPGTRLRQEQLAAELDVSRTPLREALRILEREGLVKVESKGGVRVITADVAALHAAYELREFIDGLAARLAARHHETTPIALLLSIIDRQAKALQPWNAGRYTAANVAFHNEIVQAAQNEFLLAQIPLVHMTSQVFTPVAGVDPSRAELAITEHGGILEAIEQGLEDEAERRAREHIRRTMGSFPARPPVGAGSEEARAAEDS